MPATRATAGRTSRSPGGGGGGVAGSSGQTQGRAVYRKRRTNQVEENVSINSSVTARQQEQIESHDPTHDTSTVLLRRAHSSGGRRDHRVVGRRIASPV